MTYLVHIAGPAIRAANVIRQRCAWCGALLEEHDLDRLAVQVEDGQTDAEALEAAGLVTAGGDPVSRWEGLVAVARHEHGGAMWALEDPEDGKIPEDSCMALDPAATA